MARTPLGTLYRAEYDDRKIDVDLILLDAPEQSDKSSAAVVPPGDLLSRLAQIKHTNVAAVHAVGETTDGIPYVVFEVLKGQLLSEVVDGKTLRLKDAVELILQAAAGLQAAHTAGLLHANLSPHTVLLTPTADGQPVVKLIRFGPGEPGSTRYCDDHRAAQYAAPELLAGKPIDQQADIFSLGALLQRVLVGVPASVELSKEERNLIPGDIRAVLAKALDPLPENRFQTVEAFAESLYIATRQVRTKRRPRRARYTRAIGAIRAIAESRATGPITVGAGVAAIVGLWILQSTHLTKAGAASIGAVVDPAPSTVVAQEVPSDISAAGGTTAVQESGSQPARSSKSSTAPGPAPKTRGGEVQSDSLRRALQHISRVGIVVDYAEARPGLLSLSLKQSFNSFDPQVEHDLRPLYEAYLAYLQYPDQPPVLELRQHGTIIGQYTSEGLVVFSKDGTPR